MRTAQPWRRGVTAASLAVLATGAATMTDRARAVVTTPLTATVVVSNAGAYVQDVNLTTRITHPHTNDLSIYLTSPSGTRVPIFTRSPLLDGGNSQTDVFDGTVWDDSAGLPVTDHAFGAGAAATLTPEGALGAFVGEPANGTWTLTVVDEDPFMQGTLSGFDLQVVTRATAENAADLGGVNSVRVAIPDRPSADTAATPLERTLNVATGGYNVVQDVNVPVSIDHPAAGELTIELISPSGAVETLSSRNGGAANVFTAVTFNDSATGSPPVTDNSFSPPPVELTPEGALARFIGGASGGTWTLRITDGAVGNAGFLDAFTIDIKGLTAAPSTTTRTVSSSGGARVIPDAQPDPVAPPPTDPGTAAPATPVPAPGLVPVAPGPAGPGTTTPGTTRPAPGGTVRPPRLLRVAAPARGRIGARTRVVARFTAAPTGPVELQRSLRGGFRTIARARVRNGRVALPYTPRVAGRHVLRLRWRVPGGARAGAPITLRVRR